ncbi:MAG: methyltransferase domain-containing protein [Acidimicrobiales bacterium]|nr:methyltransferase domain-containing protein [Acidimicrobiales bacterium]
MTTINTEIAHPASTTVTIGEQAPRLLAQVAGYVGHRTAAIGLRHGLIEALAEHAPLTPDELSQTLELDPFYVAVWCRAALASGILERVQESEAMSAPAGLGGHYVLAPHMRTLLLDTGHPAYMGGVFTVLEAPEVFERFEASLGSGERLWWDGCSPDWIAGVAGTGTPFYTRLAPGALAQVPGLADRLEAGCVVVDTACGSGMGVVHLARVYPNCQIVGVDGDRHSIEQARRRLRDAELLDRCRLVHSPLEELVLDELATCVINNISMHECRDIDRVCAQVHAALEPGGWLVISDFPFPDTAEGLRSVPGQVMTGIQYFEAQIDDQLLPRSAYDELLGRQGFTELGYFQLSPLHAVTYGRRHTSD